MKSVRLTLMAPAVWLSGQLSFASKFAFVGGLSLLIGIYITVPVFEQANRSIALVQVQQTGLESVCQHVRLLSELVLLRSQALTKDSESAVQSTAALTPQIQDAIGHANASGNAKLADVFAKEWANLQKIEPGEDKRRIFAAYTAVIHALATQIRENARAHRFNLDPELDAAFDMLSNRLPSVIDVLEKQHDVLAMDTMDMATFALTAQVALDEAMPALRAGVNQLKKSVVAIDKVDTPDLTPNTHNPANAVTQAFDQLTQGLYQQQDAVDQLGATVRISAEFAPQLEKLYLLAHANVDLSKALIKTTERAIGAVLEHRKQAVLSSRQWLMGALLFGTFVNGYLFYGFYIGILKSVNALTRGTTAFCAGNHAARIAIHSQDELLVLGTNFNTIAQEVERLMGTIHSQNQVRERDLKVLVDALETKNEVLFTVNERVHDELNLARSVQLAILPQQFPKEESWSVHACMHPARELGGDFYDCFALPDGRHGILVADVSGKGVGAAFFMAVSRTVLLDSALAVRSPAQVLALANDLLCTRNPMDLFVTACYGIYDPREGTLVYACAGHMPPLVRHAHGEVEILSSTNDMALGVLPEMPYSEHCLTLAQGDTLLMYTDGITEAFSSQGSAFGDARLKDWLSASQPHRGTQWMVEDLVQSVADFVDGAEASDDLTCLFLCRSGLSP